VSVVRKRPVNGADSKDLLLSTAMLEEDNASDHLRPRSREKVVGGADVGKLFRFQSKDGG